MHKILIVDDEINNINHLSRILTPMYDVVVAKNGQAGIEKAIKHTPDLILLDVIMPDMMGFDVITILKETEATKTIPVIFITGLDSDENEEKGLLLGAVDYITKPFKDFIVRARVRTHLQIVEYISTIDRLSKIDALTNIPNRRYFNDQIAIEWGRAARDKKDIGMLMIDIDFFKKYNDAYGHMQGDILLKTIASIFEKSLNRPADFVARWGGEEFVMLLPGTDLEGAIDVGERVRSNVESADFPIAGGSNTNVTVSIGANSVVPDKDESIDTFISKADNSLYSAKGDGRNCVRPVI